MCFATLKPCLYPEEKLFAIRTHAACVQHASLEQSNFEFVFHFSCSKELNWLALTLKRLPRLAMFSRCKKVRRISFVSNRYKMCQKSAGLSRRMPAAAWAEKSVFICGTNCRVWQVWHLLLLDHIGRFLATKQPISHFLRQRHPLLLSTRGADHFYLSAF